MLRRRRRLLRLLVVLGAIVAGAGWLHRRAQRAAEAHVVREAFLAEARASGYDTIIFGRSTSFLEYELDALDIGTGKRVGHLRASLAKMRGSHPSLAPDGRTVAFCAKGVLEVADIPTGRIIGRFALANRRVIPDTPAWSPDGRRLAVEVTPPGSIDEWPEEDGGTPIWIVEPETGTGRLLVVSEVPRKAQWEHVYWRADGRALYIEWQEHVPGTYIMWRDRRFRTSEVNVATGKVIQDHPVAMKWAGPDGWLIVDNWDGPSLRRTPQGSGTSLAAARHGYGHWLLDGSRYVVYFARRGKFKPSAFFALDMETGVAAQVVEFGIGGPIGFDLARVRSKSGGSQSQGESRARPDSPNHPEAPPPSHHEE